MFDKSDAIRIIEDALDQEPYCAICDRPTTIRDADGVLFLTCRINAQTGGFLTRLSAAILGHTDREILDLRMSAAA